MNADGKRQRNLTHNAANDYLSGAAPWSPDGRKLILQRDRNGDGGSDDIYVINTDRSGERYLTRGRKPRWSPDGQEITFTSKRENWPEIYVINADGSGQQRLTRGPARTINARTVNDPPIWSPAQK
jgi:TolB protein